jgi:dimethylamine/trimethylamine dehydrogenase
VVDYRQYQIGQRTNVETYFDSRLGVEDILGFGFEHVAIATGSRWRRDGVARQHVVPMPIDEAMTIWTPDDIMSDRHPADLSGKTVVVYDDDHYYMGGVMAEVMAKAGANVILVTPSAYVSDWTRNTLEQGAIHVRLDDLGVDIRLNRGVTAIRAGEVETNCTYTGRRKPVPCDAVVMVASRASEDTLYHEVMARKADWADAGIKSVKLIGDAAAPAPIAWATYAGHRYARELDTPDIGDALPFRREVTQLEPA